VSDDLRAIIGILDFGDMIHAPRVFEIAVIAAETGGRDCTPIDDAAEIVAGYSSITPLDDAEYPALYDAILMRHAISATIHAWRVAHDPSGAAKLGNLSAASRVAIEVLLAAGSDAAVARWRAAAASPTYDRASPDAFERLVARRHQLLGRGLELSYAHPVHAVRGEGVFLYDADGRRLLDTYNNVAAVGHGHPRVVAAVTRQLATLNTNTRYVNGMVLDYAERIGATLNNGLGCCVFVNSGSEANDVAWRIAQAVTGRRGAIVMADAYHGISDAVAALSPYYGTRAQPLGPHVEALEAPDRYRGRLREDALNAAAGYAADAQRALAALAARGYAVGAFFVDSGFVSNGILDAPPGYLAAVVATIRAAGGLIVADEVQAGFGRCGDAFWGFARHGIIPDIVTLGKPMGNGYPVGAAVTRPEILQTFTDRIEFFSTFGGNPVAAAASLATLDVIVAENLQANAARTGDALRTALRDLAQAHPMIGDVRGSGLLIGVEIVSDPVRRTPAPAWAKQIANAMRDAGVLIGTEGPAANVLKIRPPLPFGPRHIPLMLAALATALATLRANDEYSAASR
jgi:4-aminobutyrate aminotransferase-like enzyme